MILYNRRIFDNGFHLHIKKSLLMFPKNYKHENSNVFWASPKRCHQVIKFNSDKENHVHCLVAGVTIMCQFFRKEEVPRLFREKIKQISKSYTPLTLVHFEEQEEVLAGDRNPQVQRIRSHLVDLSPDKLISLVNFKKTTIRRSKSTSLICARCPRGETLKSAQS